MNSKFFWILLLPICAMGQQNLFNIPSGDITPHRNFFYQHQINAYSINNYESKSHLVYGLGKGWDAGVNLVDLPINIRRDGNWITFNDFAKNKPLYPLLMGTLQKQISITEHLQLNTGLQIGTNLTHRFGNKKIAHFLYALARIKPFKRGHLVVGSYHSNNVFRGISSHSLGWMIGYEFPMNKHFSLMGDVISGDHKKSNTSFGGLVNLSNRVQLCMAALLPFPNNDLPTGMIAELNVYGWNYKDYHH